MSWQIYVQLSLMMFLQFAVWGAWSPVLASRLLGSLKMSGKQTGWIYGTIYLGCIISPLIAGQIADRWVATEYFLAAAHLAGGVLLLAAARQRRFTVLFAIMFVYALAFAPTLALVNSLMFAHLTDPANQSFGVLLWGTVGWAVAGWALTFWRRLKGSGEGADCLVLAGALSLAMGLYCLSLPHTPPPGRAGDVLPFLKALGLLSNTNFLIFLIVGFLLATQLQFFFLGTAPYLSALGVPGRSIPAVMTLAQVAQLAATVVLAFQTSDIRGRIGFVGIFTIGIAMWLAMYAAYALIPRRVPVILSQALHGLAYTFFIWVGFVYVNEVAPPDIRGSAQGLYTVVLFGFGCFLGTQFTGIVMDKLKTPQGSFRWRPLFLVPCGMTLICLIVMAAMFRG